MVQYFVAMLKSNLGNNLRERIMKFFARFWENLKYVDNGAAHIKYSNDNDATILKYVWHEETLFLDCCCCYCEA